MVDRLVDPVLLDAQHHGLLRWRQLQSRQRPFFSRKVAFTQVVAEGPQTLKPTQRAAPAPLTK